MTTEPVEARLAQLNQAKALVQADPSYFPQIVLGVLPVLLDPELELRKWVSDFLLTAFSSLQMPAEEKQNLALQLVGKLAQAMLSEASSAVQKCYIQVATLLYPLIFSHVYVVIPCHAYTPERLTRRRWSLGMPSPISNKSFSHSGNLPRRVFGYVASSSLSGYCFVKPTQSKTQGFVYLSTV